jgi:general stress protein 26
MQEDIDVHTKRAAEVIKLIRYATIATASKDGKPWNSPVAHEYDNDLNIYWFSDKESQHSRNVRENENVFIVIYDSTVPEGKGKGVYFEAKVVELSHPDETDFAWRIKKGPDHAVPADHFLGDAITRVYKAVPSRIWVNSAEVKDGIFLRNYRIEIPADALKDELA